MARFRSFRESNDSGLRAGLDDLSVERGLVDVIIGAASPGWGYNNRRTRSSRECCSCKSSWTVKTKEASFVRGASINSSFRSIMPESPFNGEDLLPLSRLPLRSNHDVNEDAAGSGHIVGNIELGVGVTTHFSREIGSILVTLVVVGLWTHLTAIMLSVGDVDVTSDEV